MCDDSMLSCLSLYAATERESLEGTMIEQRVYQSFPEDRNDVNATQKQTGEFETLNLGVRSVRIIMRL